MRRFFRIIYYTGGILCFLAIALVGYTQTRSFKKNLHKTLLQESQSVLNAQIRFGTIEGNLITGFAIDSVSIVDQSGRPFFAERIELAYDIFGFLFKRVAISRAIFVKPSLHIYRSIDGSWNVSHLVKPAPEDTLPSAWVIDIKKVELQDAEVLFTDSLLIYRRQTGDAETPPDSVIDYARIHLFSLSLDASALIEEGEYRATIRRFQFFSREPNFVLRNLEGDLSLTGSEVSIRDVRIETAHSLLRIDAGMQDVDLAALSNVTELKQTPVTLSLSADGIDTRELKQFLYPSVDFLQGVLKLQLKAKGAFGDLKVDRLAIQMPRSSVSLQGRLRNLHTARNLEMNVQAEENTVTPQDLLDCLPGLHIPDLTFLGPCKFSFLYDGRPLDFKAHIAAVTQVGAVTVDGEMKIVPEDVRYKGTLVLESVSLGPIFQNEKLASDLKARMTIDAAGFNPRTLTGIARIEIDSSTVSGLPLHHSVLVVDAAEGTFRSHLAATLGSGTYEVSNTMNFFHQDSSTYTLSGKMRSIDLAELLKNRQYESDLSFDLAASGKSDNEMRLDTASLQFYRSAFQARRFEAGDAQFLSRTNKDQRSHLRIASTLGELSIDGQFTPNSFLAAWKNSFQHISESIGYRFRNLDSLHTRGDGRSTPLSVLPSRSLRTSPLESQFHLRIKDFSPVGAFLLIPMTGRGALDGTIRGDTNTLSLQGTVHLEQFGVRTGSDTLTADTAHIQYSFDPAGEQNDDDKFAASLQAHLANFTLNAFVFNNCHGNIRVRSDSSYFQISTLIDSTASVTLEGTSEIHDGFMDFVIPVLKTEVNQYDAENKDTVLLSLGRDGFRVNTWTMVHESEEANISGSFSPSGMSDLKVTVSGFLLSNLKQILHRGPYGKSGMHFGGRVDASAAFRGNFASPDIVIDVHAEGVRAEDTRQNKSHVLGKVESHLAYSEHMLQMFVKLMGRSDDSGAPPDALLSGSLPYEFVLARETPHRLAGQIDLVFKASNMDMKFLDPFIPEISNLSGALKCDMRMKGPYENPVYEGSMSIQQAGFIFDPLGIRYIMNGNLIPAGDRIRFEQFTIQNDPLEEKQKRIMNISGTFTLLGLRLKQFDIVAQGDLKVMTEDRRLPGQKLYGNVYAATGSNGIMWRGDLTSSLVRGEVYVKEAQLILPPDREAEVMRTSVVQRVFQDDTSKIVIDVYENSTGVDENRMNESVNGKKGNSGRMASLPPMETEGNSFLDGINYDLGIETKGTTTLRFVFNTQTSEELYADLQGRLYFYKTPEMSRVTGQVEVGKRSYYNFIKKFEATGNLLFTGDIFNPELDVLGTYQGAHADTSSHTSSSEGGREEQVLVTLHVTGTRNEPKTKISLQTKKSDQKDWKNWDGGDEEANAISFILAGQFRDALTDQQRMGLIGSNLGLALASGMVMGPLSESLRRSTWGYIQSVDVIYAGGQFNESADVRLTGQVGEAVIRMGGRVLSDLTNANVSVELPVSSIVNSERFRNLILTLERRVEGIQSAEEQRRASNGARLFYRITF